MDAHFADFKGSSSEVGQDWATRGWLVFFPNPRGSTNYGSSFMAAAVGDLGGGDLDDVLAGVDALENGGLVTGTLRDFGLELRRLSRRNGHVAHWALSCGHCGRWRVRLVELIWHVRLAGYRVISRRRSRPTDANG